MSRLDITFNFTGDQGLAGSAQQLAFEEDTLPEDFVGKVVVRPLKKENLINEVSIDNFAASNWPVWDSPRGTTDLPDRYILLKIEGLENEGRITKFKSTRINFFLMRDGSGPRHWQWRSNADKFGAPLPIEGIGEQAEELGIEYEDGIITLPPTPPSDPPYFGPFFINFGAIEQQRANFSFGRADLQLRLYGYYEA
jgi:hypothetical protein